MFVNPALHSSSHLHVSFHGHAKQLNLKQNAEAAVHERKVQVMCQWIFEASGVVHQENCQRVVYAENLQLSMSLLSIMLTGFMPTTCDTDLPQHIIL